jgi:hypothetical protein
VGSAPALSRWPFRATNDLFGRRGRVCAKGRVAILDLLATIKAAKTLSSFVEGGALGEALSDAGLRAAHDALEKVPDAMADGQQVWSAINHLEFADAALAQLFARRGEALLWSRRIRFWELVGKRRYILCLMAVCYRYVGEEKLARRALWTSLHDEEWGTVPEEEGSVPRVLGLWAVQLANPLSWVDAVVKDDSFWLSAHAYFTDERITEIEDAVFAMPKGSLPARFPGPQPR